MIYTCSAWNLLVSLKWGKQLLRKLYKINYIIAQILLMSHMQNTIVLFEKMMGLIISGVNTLSAVPDCISLFPGCYKASWWETTDKAALYIHLMWKWHSQKSTTVLISMNDRKIQAQSPAYTFLLDTNEKDFSLWRDFVSVSSYPIGWENISCDQ